MVPRTLWCLAFFRSAVFLCVSNFCRTSCDVDISPVGGEEHLETVYYLAEEHQRLRVILHRLRHTFSRCSHLLPEHLDVLGVALHGAGGQLHCGPQLVQTLLLGELHGGALGDF